MPEGAKQRFSFRELQQAAAAESFWRKMFSREIPETRLFSGASSTDEGGRCAVTFPMPGELFVSLEKRSKNNPLSRYLILLTNLLRLLQRYAHQESLFIGIHALKEGKDGAPAAGILPLVFDAAKGEGFKETLFRVRETALAAWEHQEHPIGAVFDKLGKPRASPHMVCRLAGGAETADELKHPPEVDVVFSSTGDGCACRMNFDAARVSEEMIRRFYGHLQRQLAFVLDHADEDPAACDILSETEKNEMKRVFNRPPAARPPAEDVLFRFESQVEKSPEAVALTDETGSLTYARFHQLVNRMAWTFHREYGIGPNDAAAIVAPRSKQTVAALWGVLRAGGAYLPIDLKTPRERIHYILQDSGCKLIITDAAGTKALPENLDIPIFPLDEQTAGRLAEEGDPPPPAAKPEDLAYVIYTSGSTGTPKGCLLERRNLAHYILWAARYYFENTDLGHFGLYSSLSFDLTVTSLFSPFMRGKSLHIYPETADIEAILRHSFSPETPIDVIKITPAHISLLKGLSIQKTNIRLAIVGGEQLTRRHVETLWEIRPDMEIVNEYGPTEATVGCIVKSVKPEGKTILIGRPIENMEAYVLDAHMRPVPAGVSGTLYVGGHGVARGYLNRPDLTAARFVDHPFDSGRKMYNTGDLARFTPQGELECLGRDDDQVKIRGFRVELGEIENRLVAHPEVQESVVTARRLSGADLEAVAYYTAGSEVPVSELRAHLGAALPDYMIPSRFIRLAALPLTINGKVDKRALPAPDEGREGLEAEYEAPRDELETGMARIWSEILGRDKIGIHDNFFELGGHSIKATQLMSRIHKVMKISLGLREIFDAPTVAALSDVARRKDPKSFVRIENLPPADTYAVSHAQKRLWLTEKIEGNPALYHLHGAFRITGPLSVELLEKAFADLVSRHESLRTTFVETGGELFQRVQPPGGFSMTVIEKPGAPEDAVAAIAEEITRKPFDLTAAPPFRAVLVKTAPETAYLVAAIHHIISDGWSMIVLLSELQSLYSAYRKEDTSSLPALPVQYKDYAAWHNRLLAGETGEILKSFWHRRLADKPPAPELVTDYPRPEKRMYHSDAVSFPVEASLYEGLNRLGNRERASLYMVLTAGLAALVHRYTGREDLMIGTAVAGRPHPDLENQIGFFVNMLPLRFHLTGDESFRRTLRAARKTIGDAYDNQLYPFDRLVRELDRNRPRNRFPFFDVVIDLQSDDQAEMELEGGVRLTPIEERSVVGEYDLAFFFREGNQALRLIVEFDAGLYRRDTVVRTGERLLSLLSQVAGDPDIPLSRVDLGETDVAPAPAAKKIQTRLTF